MTIKKVRDRINAITGCFEFEYKGKRGGVDPFSQNKFEIFYGDFIETVDSIEKVMNTPFIDGKRIKDVLNELEIISLP